MNTVADKGLDELLFDVAFGYANNHEDLRSNATREVVRRFTRAQSMLQSLSKDLREIEKKIDQVIKEEKL